MTKQRDERSQRALWTVIILALVALVALLLGHRWLDGYLETQRARNASQTPDVSSTAGAAGQVLFADGSPAAGVRVNIVWRDSAGRAGSTPSVTDATGAFVQANVPLRSTISEVRATLGPLVAKAGAESLSRAGTAGTRAKLAFPAAFRLAGLVRRNGDRAVLPGATLDVAGLHAVAGASGEFAIDAIPAAVLRESRPVIRVAANGCSPLDWPLPKDALPEAYGDLTILMTPSK